MSSCNKGRPDASTKDKQWVETTNTNEPSEIKLQHFKRTLTNITAFKQFMVTVGQYVTNWTTIVLSRFLRWWQFLNNVKIFLRIIKQTMNGIKMTLNALDRLHYIQDFHVNIIEEQWPDETLQRLTNSYNVWWLRSL